MPKLIKNIIGGGAMAKSVMLRVFLEPKTYLELVAEAKNYNIPSRTDSELVGNMLKSFLHIMPVKQIEIEQLRRANDKKQAVIETFEKVIDQKKEVKKSKKKK